jgi:type II secretory pathway pseudopilin PulG
MSLDGLVNGGQQLGDEVVERAEAGAPAGRARDRISARDPDEQTATVRLGGATVAVVIVGVLFTTAVTLAVGKINQRNEHRLLRLQTEQAADVLTAAIPAIETPVTTAARVAAATHGDPVSFLQLAAPTVGRPGSFRSLSLWKVENGAPSEVAVLGPALNRWPAGRGFGPSTARPRWCRVG